MFVLLELQVGAAKKVFRQARVPSIPAAGDFRRSVKEAAIRIEAALIAAEMLATHGVVESLNYDRLIDSLQEASMAVERIDVRLLVAPAHGVPEEGS